MAGDDASALMVPEVKDKRRTGQVRECAMDLQVHVCCAAWALRALQFRLFGVGQPSGKLFPHVRADGTADVRRTQSATTFKRLLRVWAEDAGVSDADVARVPPHSLRAGGCTDYLSWGCSARWVKRQGGWRSNCFEQYYRPRTAELLAMRRKLRRAQQAECKVARGAANPTLATAMRARRELRG